MEDYSGKTVRLKLMPMEGQEDDPLVRELQGQEMRVEGLWNEITGGSWMWAKGNPAAMKYAVRSSICCNLPVDDDVFYGKVGAFGHLVHVSEIEEVIEEGA